MTDQVPLSIGEPTPGARRELRAARRELDRLGKDNAGVLAELRSHLRVLYNVRVARQGREEAFVTADDARRYMARYPELEARLSSNNALGSLFGPGSWEPTGDFIRSETEGSHGNLIRCWMYVG